MYENFKWKDVNVCDSAEIKIDILFFLIFAWEFPSKPTGNKNIRIRTSPASARSTYLHIF